MTVTACPVAVVGAPIETVWRLLTTPETIPGWADVELVAAEPPGPAVEGQRIRFWTRGLGRRWQVHFVMGPVVAPRSIEMAIHLPLGVVNHEHITLVPLSERATRVTFN